MIIIKLKEEPVMDERKKEVKEIFDKITFEYEIKELKEKLKDQQEFINFIKNKRLFRWLFGVKK